MGTGQHHAADGSCEMHNSPDIGAFFSGFVL
jgi:hypothetical protein